MKLVDMKCPRCGANIKVDSDLNEATCEFCRSSFLLDDEVQHIQFDNMEQSGYDMEVGRKQATLDEKEKRKEEALQQRREQLLASQKRRSGFNFNFSGNSQVLKIIGIVVLAIIALGVMGSIIGKKNNPTPVADTTVTESPISETQDQTTTDSTITDNTLESGDETTDDIEPVNTPKPYHYKAELSNGFYASNYFIPPGIYTLKCISGSGNVFSNNLNEIFGKDKDWGHIKKYSNLEIEEEDILHVCGDLVLSIESKNAIKPEDKYTNPVKKSKTFSSGNYKCGKHIKSGLYDVSLVSGSGNVFIGSEVNEIFGRDRSWGHITKVKHVLLSEGDEISLSGVKVKFTPSKIKLEKNKAKK